MGARVLWSGARESVYTFQAQKSNVQFLAIAYEHACECDRVLNPGASLNSFVVVSEVVIPDVELLETGHLKYSLIVLEDLIEQTCLGDRRFYPASGTHVVLKLERIPLIHVAQDTTFINLDCVIRVFARELERFFAVVTLVPIIRVLVHVLDIVCSVKQHFAACDCIQHGRHIKLPFCLPALQEI
nr:MAG TPA_asm: hypothetical protein [Bacteriophage sp.]